MLHPNCRCAGLYPLLLYSLFLAASAAYTQVRHSSLVVGLISSTSFTKVSLASPPCRSVLPCCHGALAPMTLTTQPLAAIFLENSPTNSRPWSITISCGTPKFRTQNWWNFIHTCMDCMESNGSRHWWPVPQCVTFKTGHVFLGSRSGKNTTSTATVCPASKVRGMTPGLASLGCGLASQICCTGSHPWRTSFQTSGLALAIRSALQNSGFAGRPRLLCNFWMSLLSSRLKPPSRLLLFFLLRSLDVARGSQRSHWLSCLIHRPIQSILHLLCLILLGGPYAPPLCWIFYCSLHHSLTQSSGVLLCFAC